MRIREERREHARIDTGLVAWIQTENGPVEQQVCNLGKGGALIRARGYSIEPGSRIQLQMGFPGGGDGFEVTARVRDVGAAQDPVKGDPVLNLHVEFVFDSDEKREELQDLIEAIMGAGGLYGRSAPRVHRRFVAEFDDRDELARVYAENISQGGVGPVIGGGLGLFVECTDVSVGEKVYFAVVHPDSGARIEHEAVVAHAERDPSGSGKRIGLQLQPLGEKASIWERFVHDLL